MIVTVGVMCGSQTAEAVAAGDANEAQCPSATEVSPGFRTYLPDCRAYELVTPPEKGGARVEPVIFPTVADDGSSLVGKSTDAFAGLSNGELRELSAAYYLFKRTSTGWSTTPLDPPRAALESAGIEDSVWGPASSGLEVPRLSLVNSAGAASEVGPVWPPTLGATPLGPHEDLPGGQPFEVRGAAREASRAIVFDLTKAAVFWPFDSTLPEDGPSLYEYVGTANTVPTLVGVSGGPASTTLISQCGTELGGLTGIRYNAVSESGQTIYFTAAGADSVLCEGTEPSANELFARIAGARTVAISEPSSEDCSGCDTSSSTDANFEGASANGSKVFFTTTQALLGSDTSENLYEYDFNPPEEGRQPKVVRVSAGAPAADVLGTTRISEDGSHVYFVARGILTNEPDRSLPSGHEVAQEGADNLYVYERDEAFPRGRVAFIAELCSDAGESGEVGDPLCPTNLVPGFNTDSELWGVGFRPGEAQATPDGNFLVFTSYGDLTPGDTSSAKQVFEYDAPAGTLVRISTGESGFNDDGNAVGAGHFTNNDARIVTQAFGGRGGALARTMADDGSYVFFQSPVGLTPQALNDVLVTVNSESEPEYAQNVYEYHDGSVYLISDGQDLGVEEQRSSVQLIGTSENGSDVFFSTTDNLVPQDTDTQVDFYDARSDGGFPAPSTARACEGESCEGPLGVAPVFEAPSSVTFSGNGNVAPRPPTTTTVSKKMVVKCRKGEKQSHGKCVKAKKKQKAKSTNAKKTTRSSGR